MTSASIIPSHGNILLVANYDSDVGYAWWLMENFWAEIARYFSTQGVKCYLIYPRINKIPESISSAPIELVEIDFMDHSSASIGKLKNLIQTNNIKNIYLTDRPAYEPLYLKMRQWGVRKIVNHDHTPGERPAARLAVGLLKKIIHQLGIISCDNYIGVSKFVRNRLISNACIPKRKCSYVLNGIVPVTKEARCQDYAYEEFSIPAGAIIVATTGRAIFYKGINFIINCAAEIVHKHNMHNVYFLYCGNGPNMADFKLQVEKLNLQTNFIFAGQRNDVKCILQSCDIGIQASKGEAFSLSILEYLSAGLPTLVPDICGNSEAVNSEHNGYLYTPGNTDQVVSLLLKLIKDENLRNTLGSAATQSVEEKFNLEKTNETLLKQLSNFFV